ncbi:MAG: helix-turn-helix domain-containing protein [Actinomycetes bacterium]|jgi:excisionase family DNA binding protein|nr:helix-turn-helix domain-containing protein [Actinomycetota bacterium]
MPAPVAPLTPSASDAVSRLNRLAYSAAEVAQLFGLSKATIYNMMNRGELRYTTIANRRRVPLSEVERLATVLVEDGAA